MSARPHCYDDLDQRLFPVLTCYQDRDATASMPDSMEGMAQVGLLYRFQKVILTNDECFVYRVDVFTCENTLLLILIMYFCMRTHRTISRHIYEEDQRG